MSSKDFANVLVVVMISIIVLVSLCSTNVLAQSSNQQIQAQEKVDLRTDLHLPSKGRDKVLAEMRQLLKASFGVISGLSTGNMKQVEQGARSGGMGIAADMDPAIMNKLPTVFREMGMSVHRDFDALADGVVQGESTQQILTRLSSLMSHCVACHEQYRLHAP